MAKTLSAIRAVVQQFLRDEFKGEENTEFEPDELDLHISQVLVEISKRSPYEVKETVVSDGTRDINLSTITGLIGDKVEKAEYPVGNYPPDYINDFEIFGNTLKLNIDSAPSSGANIYLYCHKVHQLTESSSTLNPVLEEVLVEGVVAKCSMAWLNKMRDHIVPNTVNWYHTWAAEHYAIYQRGLNSITQSKVWEYY